jgi:hypothetical protein
MVRGISGKHERLREKKLKKQAKAILQRHN